nr:MAG TPA: hypothetical protein [Caudoviricetes sp.]
MLITLLLMKISKIFLIRCRKSMKRFLKLIRL